MESGSSIDMNCEYLGITRLVLMENAGKEIAKEAAGFDKIAIFCGTGNNGGDGFVAARHLAGQGKQVTVYAISGKRSKEAQTNYDILLGLDSVEIVGIRDSKNIEKTNIDADLIIDALVGVGIKGELREPAKSIVNLINGSKAKKLSVDVPTGYGKVKVKADVTISFHKSKVVGAKVVDIGIPKEAELYCGPGDFYASFPRREGGEHKGNFGKVLVVGGSSNFFGAPVLAAMGALRVGADLAVIACPNRIVSQVSENPNLIVNPLKSESFLCEKDVKGILETDFDCMIIGNGLGVEKETQKAVREIVRSVKKPVVIDADALKALKPKDLGPNVVVTPHAREFEILFGGCEADFEKRVKQVEKCTVLEEGTRDNFYVHRYVRDVEGPKNETDNNFTILLKGQTDIISNGKNTKLNKTGNPGMTVGGTGDVLSGVVAGLIAGNYNGIFEAACAGAFICGLAGGMAFQDFSYSLLATDLIENLPDAIKFCEGFR